MNNMENINPEQLNEWIAVFWSIGWKGLIVFAVIYYKEVVVGFFRMIFSWFEKK